MLYRLISKGKVRENVDEADAVVGLVRLTGLPLDRLRSGLLSGKVVKLKSSTDKDLIDDLYRRFDKAGLDVEVVDMSYSETDLLLPVDGEGNLDRSDAAG